METALKLVPDMVHPLGKAWEQPDRSKIKIAFGTAWVSKKDFEKLPEYSTSIPSGVYAGKMWRCEYKEKNKNGGIVTKHLLRWYQDSAKPDHCDIKQIDLMIE